MAIEIYNPTTPLNQTTNPSPKVLVLNDETGMPTYAEATLLRNVFYAASEIDLAALTPKYGDLCYIGYIASIESYNKLLIYDGSSWVDYVIDKASYSSYDSDGNQITTTYATKTENDLKQTVFTGICQQQYLTENDIYINATDATVVVGGVNVPAKNLAILTVRGGTAISASNPICFYTDGSGVATKHIKTEPQFVPFADLPTPTDNTGVWYFYFDSTGTLTASKTAWTSFDNIAAVYRLYWNNGLSGAARNVIESIECHKNDISWADHAWKHNEGTKWISGFNITYETTTGTPSATGLNTCVALSTGKNVDDNLFYEVKNVASPVNKFEQDLGSAASITAGGQFICTYNDSNGLLNKIAATRFPFLFNGSNTPEYVTKAGNRTSVTPNYFFVYYIYALQDPRVGEAVKIRSAVSEFASASLASAHSWEQLQSDFPTLQDNEIRVLYKLTYEYKSAYDVAVKKAALREVVDLRRQKISSLIASGGSVLASSVVVAPSGGITSTNAQGAFNETGSHISNGDITKQHVDLTNTDVVSTDLNGTTQTLVSGRLKRYTYAHTNASTFTIALPADVSKRNIYEMTFATGATVPTINWPTVSWNNGVAPTTANIGANKKYHVIFDVINTGVIFASYGEY